MKGVSEALLSSLHPLELKVIPHLKEGSTLSELVAKTGMQEVEVMRALQWLENKKAVALDQLSRTEVLLDENGKKALNHNLPEMRVYKAAQDFQRKPNSERYFGLIFDESRLEQLGLEREEAHAVLSALKNLDWVDVTFIDKTPQLDLQKKLDKDINKYPLFLLIKKIEKGVNLDGLSSSEKQNLDLLKKRKKYVILKEKKDRIIHLTEIGKELVKVDVATLDFAERLTSEDLKSGAWKTKKYRSYDVSINVPKIPMGKEHFVQEAIDYIRRIWIEMGFEEMEGTMVQSAFWDLDVLFVPQDHPARETQDTFYLENPSRTTVPRQLFDKVREVHETGGNTGSKGWRYSFSRAETEQLMLRTHTTALSAQTLWAIKEGRAKMPGKYFTVSRVFRNEALDWKHLFEFHQVEGIVVDPNVTFAQLIGYLKIFFAKMGFPEIRLRPHHFPYTEPSVEVDVWHPKKKQWVELGGAGVFRPEVTKTLLGEEVPVLAWGLGMERIIVEYFDLHDLRDLYRNDIKQMREMKRFIKL